MGTQFRPGSIDDALRADNAHRALEPPCETGKEYGEKEEQQGIVARSGLTLHLKKPQQIASGLPAPSKKQLKLPTWLGADIRGDEKHEGPIYNYARVFTWWQSASIIEAAFDTTITNLEGRRDAHNRPWIPNMRAEDNLVGDAIEMAIYSGLATERATEDNIEAATEIESLSIAAYPEWASIRAHVWNRIIFASFVALFVQWGTTGPAILIGYTTPTKGVGTLPQFLL